MKQKYKEDQGSTGFFEICSDGQFTTFTKFKCEKNPFQTHSISDYLYVHQRRDISFMH